MAKQRNDFGRAWRDKNKFEKSCGYFLFTKRTCKNIQEPTVCRIVLGRLNLKLCPETKKNTQEYSSWKNLRIMVISWWTSHDLVRKKTFVRKCYAYQSRLMLPFSSGSGQSTCGKSQEQNWLVSYSFKLTSPNKLVKKRKNKLDRLNEQNSDIYYGLNMEKNMGPRISLSNDPEICQATFLYSHSL